MDATLQNLPNIRLSYRQYVLPVFAALLVLLQAALLAAPFTMSSTTATLQLVCGLAVAGAGLAWLCRSWRPGAATPRDIIAPWSIVFATAIAGYALGGHLYFSTDLFLKLTLLALPTMLGLTLWTRLYAPTDLCSASSAMGFCTGGFVLALFAFATPATTVPDLLLLAALTVGLVMGTSRFTLCHLIKW